MFRDCFPRPDNIRNIRFTVLLKRCRHTNDDGLGMSRYRENLCLRQIALGSLLLD